MAQNEYTCFFISPIGSKLGDEAQRKIYEHSNTVFDALILPTLRIFGFQEGNVIRSDHEATPGRITESIDKHLRGDDLCIVDLSGLNTNVMYEYGLRVGIGKPIIAITSDSTSRLPFDVQDVRTLQYDIKTVTGLLDAQRGLEKMVRSCFNEGFQPKTGSGSFAELSERLKSIESQLAKIIASGIGNNSAVDLEGNTAEIINKLGSTIAAFNYALRTRDIQLGEQLMPRLKHELSPERYIDLVIAQLSTLGSKAAGKELKSSWPYVVQNLTLQQQYEELASYISYCNRVDLEPQELDFVTRELSALEKRIKGSNMSDDEKRELCAGIYNQTNRIYFGAYTTSNHSTETAEHQKLLQRAIDSLERAVELNPNDASYYYNLATCQEKAGRIDEAKKAIDKCLDISTEDSDHLRLAYKLYIQSGEGELAKEVKEKLRTINPYWEKMLDL